MAHAEPRPIGAADGERSSNDVRDTDTVSVAEAARLLGRDRTRIYALLRSGDLVAAPVDEDGAGPVRVVRASLERWLVAGGARGGPLSPCNAWALIGLASGDQPFSERCLGLLERAEEISRTRARLARENLVELVPRLRRRAALVVRHLPRALRRALEHDAALVHTGASAAAAYGWDGLADRPAPKWLLDAYLPLEAFSALQEQLNQFDLDGSLGEEPGATDAVLLRVVDEPWPFPPHYPLAPQPLAALDLLDYPDHVARRVGREVLSSLSETKPMVLARRSAKARAMTGPLLGRLLELNGRRGERPRVEGDPRTDTRAAAAHIVGVLWASASQGLAVKELRAAIGLSRERLEHAYEFLLANPPLGLAVQRHRDELRLVTAPEVSSSVERHVNKPREVALSKAAREVLAIIAYRQPIARSGIELIRGSASDSALDTLLERGLIARNQYGLFVTTRAFLDLLGLRDVADLPPLAPDLAERHLPLRS
jgi:segregation and condensation protein B